MNSMQPEYVVLVDAAGQPIGQAEKLSTHHTNTPLHLGFSLYVFNNQGQFLATRRAAVKKVWPTVWTNTVCGHPAPGEAVEAAIRRRAEYELGMQVKDLVCLLPDYTYQTPPYRGIIENEFCPVFAARAVGEPQPNPLEVDEYRWLEWEEFVKAAGADASDSYSWWCKDQLRLLVDHPGLLSFVR